MNHIFPRSTLAQDQSYASTILTTHVLLRGFQSGALAGPLVGGLGLFLVRRRNPSIPPVPALVRATGVSAVVGTAVLVFVLAGRMWGREKAEWRDRSWRLLGNKGQNECDIWTTAGMVIGGLGSGLASGSVVGKKGWKLRVGSVGTGGSLGLVGYMLYRHGYKEGKWEDEV